MSYSYYTQPKLPAGRTQQIDDLVKTFSNCRPINSERTVFDLPLDVRGAPPSTLRVSIPPHFPQDRPTLMVLAPVQSPLVDASGRVRCNALDSWNPLVPSSCNLVEVVRTALEQLSNSSPSMPSQSGTPSFSAGYGTGSLAQQALLGVRPGLPGNSSSNSLNAVSSSSVTVAPGPTGPSSPSPALPADLDPEQLATEQLEKLLTDPTAYEEFLARWLQHSPAGRTLQEVLSQNEGLARENLEMQAAIDEARNHVAIVRSSEYAAAKAAFDDLVHRQEGVMARLDPSRLLDRLRAAAEESDTSGDALSDALFSGALPLDQFLDQYLASRTAFHALDLKRQALEAAQQ